MFLDINDGCFYIQAMGNVGIGIGQLNREASVIEMCEKLKKNATWGHRLSKVKVSVQAGNKMSLSKM